MTVERRTAASRDDWRTPAWLFNLLEVVARRHELSLFDACAPAEEHRRHAWGYAEDHQWITPTRRTLPWSTMDGPEMTYLNPPYGTWLSRHRDALRAIMDDSDLAVCLIPARVDTRWFRALAQDRTVIFLPHRLRFGDAPHPAPFPSALILRSAPDGPAYAAFRTLVDTFADGRTPIVEWRSREVIAPAIGDWKHWRDHPQDPELATPLGMFV